MLEVGGHSRRDIRNFDPLNAGSDTQKAIEPIPGSKTYS